MIIEEENSTCSERGAGFGFAKDDFGPSWSHGNILGEGDGFGHGNGYGSGNGLGSTGNERGYHSYDYGNGSGDEYFEFIIGCNPREGLGFGLADGNSFDNETIAELLTNR